MQPSLHDLSITLSLSCSSPFCMPLSPVSKIFVMFLFLYFCPFLYPSLSSHHVLPLNCYIYNYPSSCSNLPPFSPSLSLPSGCAQEEGGGHVWPVMHPCGIATVNCSEFDTSFDRYGVIRRQCTKEGVVKLDKNM